MLYYLFQYLEESFNLPGAGVFQYISFRAAMAVIVSLVFSIWYGKKVIKYLQIRQIGETIRDLGLEGQYQKKGTPTMGGIIIIGAILIPTILFAKLHNVYVLLMLITTIWLGFLGFADDYIKVFKKNKEGLAGRYKILGQVVLGLIVGITLYTNKDVVIRTKVDVKQAITKTEIEEKTFLPSTNKILVGIKAESLRSATTTITDSLTRQQIIDIVNGVGAEESFVQIDVKSTKTTIPFLKNNEFDYASLVSFMGDNAQMAAWIVFIIAVIVITTSVSNGANMTDGLDGLATGTSAIIGATLGVFAYVSGNMVFADYLNIMYIPHTGELVIFISAFIGATVGFLWYNAFPAQVFMGDTGSLTLGGIIAVFAILIRKELLIPVLCGIFLVESISVVLQVSWFKYTKRKYGAGRRIFKMAPLHHHFQKLGIPEPKIVGRFWIVGIVLAVLTIITLKLR